MKPNILLAYELDLKGGGKENTSKNISLKNKPNKLFWVHLDANHPDTKPWLEKELSSEDPFIVEALTAEETNPIMNQIDDGVLLILRGINNNPKEDPEDMVSIRMFIDKERIITVLRSNLKVIGELEKKINDGTGPKNAGEFVCMISSKLFSNMEPFLSKLDDTTDEIEEKVIFMADASLREEINVIHKQSIMLHRYMLPQRDAIGHLRMADLDWLSDFNRRNLQEVYNRITRYIEDLRALNERSHLIKDELKNILSDKLNKNIYVLSILSAVFLPLSFLTGLFGINVGGIPGSTNVEAFNMFCILIILIVLFQIILFKIFKWF
jgi:zinc transporter